MNKIKNKKINKKVKIIFIERKILKDIFKDVTNKYFDQTI